ncbi:MAG: hypothetical protein AAB036_10485 [Elusimicrobiota bacterium]
MRNRSLPGWALMALALTCAARDYDASGDNLSAMSDRRGNVIAVSNRATANSSQIRLTSINRYGNFNYDVYHTDAAMERATSFFVDGAGAPVVAGVRLWQGFNYIWVMKYSTHGQFLWENADTQAGCAAFDIVTNLTGDIWVAASCIEDQRFPVRLLHYNYAGNLVWAQNYNEGGRNYVRNLTVDFMNRVSLTMEVDNGSGNRYPRTLVFDRYGTRLAAY